jgi:hypothetical protein
LVDPNRCPPACGRALFEFTRLKVSEEVRKEAGRYLRPDTVAAASPDHLLGPGGKAILPARYEGYSGGSWSALTGDSPLTVGYMTVLTGLRHLQRPARIHGIMQPNAELGMNGRIGLPQR